MFSKKRYFLLVIVLSFVVLAILSIYLFRAPVTIYVIERFTRELSLDVSCLSFDVNAQLDIQITEACFAMPGVNIHVNNGYYSRKKNSLSIASLLIDHASIQTENTPPKEITSIDLTQWTLPQNLPTLRVDKAVVNSSLIKHPISFSLRQPTPRSIELMGDLQGTLALKAEKNAKQTVVNANLTWSLTDLFRWVELDDSTTAAIAPLLNQTSLMDAPITSQFTFNGALINSQHQLDSAFDYKTESCSMHTEIKGQADAQVTLQNKQLDLNLSKLQTHVFFGNDCIDAVPKHPFDTPKRLLITIPEPAIITQKTATFPSLILSSDSINNNERSNSTELTLSLSDSVITFPYAQESISLISDARMLGTLVLSDEDSAKSHSRKFQLHPTQQEKPINSLQVTSTSALGLIGHNWSFENIDLQLRANQVAQFGISTQTLSTHMIGAISSSDGIVLNIDINAAGVAYLAQPAVPSSAEGFTQALSSPHVPVPIKIKSVVSNINLVGDNSQQLRASLNTKLTQVKRDSILVNRLNNQLTATISELKLFDLTGHTQMDGVALNLSPDQYLALAAVKAEHTVRADVQTESIKSQHAITVDNAFHLDVTQKELILTVSVKEQAINAFQPVLGRFMPELTLQEGRLNIDGQLQIETAQFDGAISLTSGALKYQEYSATDVATRAFIQLNSAGLQVENTSLTIGGANTGVPIENIVVEYVVENNEAQITHAHGNLLGGEFSVGELWLDERDQQVQLTVTDIDLAKVVALQQQAGIDVTGTVKGVLPVRINAHKVYIDDGYLQNTGTGRLTIDGNPAFESIAEQQSELNYLRDLQFEQLSSKVNLHSDGLLLLDFAILGKNPNQQQAVEFNYHHEENVLTLLRALRLTDSVQNQIEHKIKQGGEK